MEESKDKNLIKKKKKVPTELQIFKYLLNEFKDEFPELIVERVVHRNQFWSADKHPAIDSVLKDPLSNFELKVHLPTGKNQNKKFISYSTHSEFVPIKRLFDLHDSVDAIRVILYDRRGEREDELIEKNKSKVLHENLNKRFTKRHPGAIIQVSVYSAIANVIVQYENIRINYSLTDIFAKKIKINDVHINTTGKGCKLKNFNIQVKNAKILRQAIREGDKQIIGGGEESR